ncbi:MAG: hypothetical protein ACOYOA_16415 [Saprospiraceae bacterium]
MSDVTKISRKRFIVWGAGILSGIGLIKLIKPSMEQKKTTNKFLTQDGRLVEVETKHVVSSGEKIETSALKSWIKK